jgi:ABC-type dipeptide/oligopeptide/nickel transport system permease subunit
MLILRRLAVGFLLVVALSALLPAVWTRNDYAIQFREAPDAAPSHSFPLGTDALGRDRLARVLYGTRVSLLLAPAAALLCCAIAGILGCLAGLTDGWIDKTINAAADLFLSLPWLFLLLAVRACLPLNVSPLASAAITFLLLGALGWPAPTRVVRAAVKRLRTADFVLQARAAGCRPWRLIWRQFLPNVMPALAAQFWIAVPVFILSEATLGMLGLGISEPMPSWGGLLREVEGASLWFQPWIVAPAVLLAAVVGSFQLVMPREDYSV